MALRGPVMASCGSGTQALNTCHRFSVDFIAKTALLFGIKIELFGSEGNTVRFVNICLVRDNYSYVL